MTLLSALAVALPAAGLVPASPAAASSTAAAATTWSCASSAWRYPSPDHEVRAMLCLGENLGQLTPSLTSECKAGDSWGWKSAQCSASNLAYRLTAPNGTVYNGTLPNGTGYYWDIYGTTTHPCAVGEWTYEQTSTHSFNLDASGDTSQTQKINVAACS
ncbi:hypothetical protein [Streptomyces sp. NPDC020965]|uniref:hypothetical protein n=1 Tax=Streptomyces sp. NPDC020965 TaxID=3365105 RepID=UPI0037A2FE9B